MGTFACKQIAYGTIPICIKLPYVSIWKYSHMYQYCNIPICWYIVLFQYTNIWERSHMYAYGNIPICKHMGLLLNWNIWDYFFNFSYSLNIMFPYVIKEITGIEIVPICYDIIVTLLLVLFIVRWYNISIFNKFYELISCAPFCRTITHFKITLCA